MLIKTRYFGEIEINEETILTFEEGIPGFEDYKKYTVLKNPEPDSPFHWLQCIDHTELTFTVTNPFLYIQDYDFEIPDEIVNQLKIESYEELLILSIVVFPEDKGKITTNLRAPLIININQRLGKQYVIHDTKYLTKYEIGNIEK